MPVLAAASVSALLLSAASGPIVKAAAPCHIMIDGVCKVAVAQSAPTGPRAGNGGNGGSVYYNFYLGAPTAGNGGNGGSVKMSPSTNGSVRGASPPLAAPAVPVALTLRKCTLTISGAPVVDARGCRYNQLGQQFTLVAPSENQKYTYTIKVAWDDQKVGTGTLEGGRTQKVRDLSPLTRRGACWVKDDQTVEICAWK